MKKAVIFPGQGSQVVGMGKDLYANFSSVKHLFAEVDEEMGFSLSKIMFDGPEDNLTITSNAQPALMAVSIAILDVLEKEFNLPIEKLADYVAGHSLGEYTALCATKSMTLAECTRILKARGQAMMDAAVANPGAMAAILGTDISTVNDIAREASNKEGRVCVVANDNSKGQVVISGTVAGIEKAIALAWSRDIKRTIKLPVSGAFHSPLMAPAAQKLQEVLDTVNFKAPVVPVISNVTTQPMVVEDIKSLLVKQLTGTVRFRETMLYMREQEIMEYTEIGAGKVLTGLVKRTLSDVETYNVRNLDDMDEFIKTTQE